jgi:DNA-binding CsgD family transcriptional regulator
VPDLAARDAERVLRFVATAEDLGGDQPLAPELLTELGRLIHADWLSYYETDYVRRRNLFFADRPGDWSDDDDDDEMTDEEWDLTETHPICRRWWRDGHYSALRMSDVATARDFRQTRFYAEFWKPFGVEYELKVRLPSPEWHGQTLAFHRKAGRDFTVRDRRVLELLTPHLARLLRAAATRRLLNEALAELERADEQGSRGVIFFGLAGEIVFASPPARRFLRDFFPPASAEMPSALAGWLESRSSQPLRRRRGNRQLVVERTPDALILEERTEQVSLTARERDVLSWVARGKTNAEIAELLWLAPSTVRKHLENVYGKLGVSTRTAAVARFLGLVDATAS